MRFLLPQFLYLLPVVWLVLALMLWLARRRRRALLVKFVGERPLSWTDSGQSARRRRWDFLLLFVIVTALCTALARPMYFHFDDQSETQGAPYLIALDVSRSMLATDLKPSRYAATTNALDRFFSESRADRVGLISFAGIGYLNSPLTFDARALRTILSYISPGAQMDPGSSMASAMDRAARYFTSNTVPQRTLVLISDGEELDAGRALELARRLRRDHNITIHTIGVGTATGARIPAFRPPLRLAANPAVPGRAFPPPAIAPTNIASPEITTKLDENNLRRIANAGGGRYFRLGQDGEGLRQLREDVLKPLAEKVARADLQNYREGYFVPLAVAVAAMIARLLLGAERFVRKRALPSIAEASS
jgi:Ca-activated chloride channel family protein